MVADDQVGLLLLAGDELRARNCGASCGNVSARYNVLVNVVLACIGAVLATVAEEAGGAGIGPVVAIAVAATAVIVRSHSNSLIVGSWLSGLWPGSAVR